MGVQDGEVLSYPTRGPVCAVPVGDRNRDRRQRCNFSLARLDLTPDTGDGESLEEERKASTRPWLLRESQSPGKVLQCWAHTENVDGPGLALDSLHAKSRRQSKPPAQDCPFCVSPFHPTLLC